LVRDAYTEWGANFSFGSLPDDRFFIQLLSEELVTGIRRASENKDKIEASQGKSYFKYKKGKVINM
jgi:hypothetical protein